MMPKSAKKLTPAKRLALYRRRAKRLGLRRIEVSVPSADVPRVRSFVRALRAGGHEAEKLRRQGKIAGQPKIARTGEELVRILRQGIVERHEFELPPRLYEEPRDTGF